MCMCCVRVSHSRNLSIVRSKWCRALCMPCWITLWRGSRGRSLDVAAAEHHERFVLCTPPLLLNACWQAKVYHSAAHICFSFRFPNYMMLMYICIAGSMPIADMQSCSGTMSHRQRWFRAFWESETPRVGMEGAQGFTGWVDSQTLDWRQEQAGANGSCAKTSAHASSMSWQVSFALAILNLLTTPVLH